jgi:hypothetical protein
MASFTQTLKAIERFSADEQLRLLERLVSLLCRRTTSLSGAKRSILELEGLGKEIWQGVEAQAYVNQEGDSWNS